MLTIDKERAKVARLILEQEKKEKESRMQKALKAKAKFDKEFKQNRII